MYPLLPQHQGTNQRKRYKNQKVQKQRIRNECMEVWKSYCTETGLTHLPQKNDSKRLKVKTSSTLQNLKGKMHKVVHTFVDSMDFPSLHVSLGALAIPSSAGQGSSMQLHEAGDKVPVVQLMLSTEA